MSSEKELGMVDEIEQRSETSSGLLPELVYVDFKMREKNQQFEIRKLSTFSC